MLAARIYSEDWEIDQRLAAFGVSRSELIEIVRGVVAARADAVEDDPASAEGLLAYIFGTRLVRQVFRSKGWRKHREDNVESVKHPDRELKIIYQSVDLAAVRGHTPQAVSGKGSGADRLVSAGQGSLFPEEEMEAIRLRSLAELRSGVWFFCVSVIGDDVRAELSLPTGIFGGNFKSFIERIFIVRSGEWTSIRTSDDGDSDAAEFEPSISRK